ncbi:MAG: family deacetylase [Mucilaginibacter sp.]|nr:family deacetylase [Mucilaginibacter sp.]
MLEKPFAAAKFTVQKSAARIRTDKKTKTVAVIVAHPDDETLWAGGTILTHPYWQCFIISLCRKNDPDRAPKFAKALKVLGAAGVMGDLDDGPEQKSLAANEVKDAILHLLPHLHFDLVLTHSINGEYTRHRRHEEIGKAVIQLWHARKLFTNELWAFAYEDGHKAHYPRPIINATVYNQLPQPLWDLKHKIITETYGFEENSWEAQTTPRAEAFRQFSNADDAHQWIDQENTAS